MKSEPNMPITWESFKPFPLPGNRRAPWGIFWRLRGRWIPPEVSREVALELARKVLKEIP